MAFADHAATQFRHEDDVTWKDTLIIGVVQCLALIPGVSRSGATMSAGLLRDLDRVTVTKLSFFLSIPALLGATVLQVHDYSGQIADGVGWVNTGTATLVSFIVGYAAVAWLLRFISRHCYSIFIAYRVVLGGAAGRPAGNGRHRGDLSPPPAAVTIGAMTSVTLDDVRDAARRLDGVAHRTPVIRSRTLDDLTGAHVFLKAENLQRVGAFKFRGAYNAICRLAPEQLARGVAAYSSGNHAQAVALAARELGSTAVIVMPEDTPAAKLDAVTGYGAQIVTYDRYTGDREEIGRRLAAERGLALIPPYEHPHVIAGQGTAALELLDDVGELDTLVVPVGGGGLLAGTATLAKGLHRSIRVVGVEPQAGDDTRRSLAAGRRVRIPVPRTIADGQAADIPGELTFSINRRLVDEIVLVGDEQIRAALRFAVDRLKLVLEPSGATGVAALLAASYRPAPGERIGVILSGGNVGAARLAALLGEP